MQGRMVPGNQWKEREHRKEVPCPCSSWLILPTPKVLDS